MKKNITKDENQRKRNEYIVEYWKDNFLSVSDKYNLVNEKLNQFETALKINRTDNKPNEVELRKCFLSLVNLVKETLNPLCLNQITFPKLEGVDMTEPENQQLVDFAVDNQSRRDLLNEIADIKKYFDFLGGTEFDNTSESKATVIENAMKNIGASLDNTLMVGDTKFDIDGAHQVGIPCVAVTYGFGTLEDFKEYNAEYIVDTAEEILDIVK